MIIVVSSDPATVKALSANQANGPVYPFGARRTLARRSGSQAFHSTRGSCWDFAGMFKTLLTSEVRLTGDVYFHPGSMLGPIPAPGDSRWRTVRAIPLVASPVATGPLQEGQPANPMLQSTAG